MSIDSIIEAARHANAHDFITSLPQGYDTLVTSSFLHLFCLYYCYCFINVLQVGERGVRLSGGQKQRIVCTHLIPPFIYYISLVIFSNF